MSAATIATPNAASSATYNTASLYVGDLQPEVTEALLFEIFREVGPVVSIRVCRDAVTRRSLGYAYVNFQNPTDAERALDALNYTPIKGGKPVRIMWSHRDPSLRKSGIGNVFIKNLDKSIDNKSLYDTFSAFGNILSCKVQTDENGQSKGYGFVHFETQEAAEQAIAKVNGMLLNDKQVYVGPFIKRNERLRGSENEKKFTNVYVKNLDESISNEQLHEAFAPFGTITKAAIMSDEQTGKSKGFGFVNYENPDDAKRAVEMMNGAQIAGKNIYAGRAQKKGEREAELRAKFEQLKMERMNKYQGVNLYVKNLEDVIDEEKLRQEFSKYGTITSCKIMRDDKTGNSKGFGFVCYSAPDEATKAISEMNQRMLGNKPLYVALAERREIRKAKLELQHAQMRQAGLAQPGMPPMPFPPQPMYGYPPQGMPHAQMMAAYPNGPNMMRGARWPVAGPGQVQGRPNYAGPMPNYAGMPTGQRPQRQNRPRTNNQAVQGQAKSDAKGTAGAQKQGGQFKYTRNARNQKESQPQQPAIPADEVPVVAPAMMNGPEPLTASMLANMSEEEAQTVLGTRLFPLVAAINEVDAPKITGMLLEMETSELLHLLESPEVLQERVSEATRVLKEAEAQQE